MYINISNVTNFKGETICWEKCYDTLNSVCKSLNLYTNNAFNFALPCFKIELYMYDLLLYTMCI